MRIDNVLPEMEGDKGGFVKPSGSAPLLIRLRWSNIYQTCSRRLDIRRFEMNRSNQPTITGRSVEKISRWSLITARDVAVKKIFWKDDLIFGQKLQQRS